MSQVEKTGLINSPKLTLAPMASTCFAAAAHDESLAGYSRAPGLVQEPSKYAAADAA